MAQVPFDDNTSKEKDAPLPLRWKERTHFNFIAGQSKLRALPVVVHLLPDDTTWFGKDPSLFEELKDLLRDRVISAVNDGDRDVEPPKSRKRARKEELCVQGERLQFIFRYRKTRPRYTVLCYADEDAGTGAGSVDSRIASSSGKAPIKGGGPRFRHFPLSESTLLVWVYRFDIEDPYRPVPNEAALQFAPPSKLPTPGQQALDVEAIGRQSKAGAEETDSHGGPQDTGLLASLWGGGKEGLGLSGGGSSGGGGVRQHFNGSAALQGRFATEQGRNQEDDDIQRAIDLSLAEAVKSAGGGEEEDVVEVLEEGGVEGSKGGS